MENLTNSQKSIWVTEQYYNGSSVNTISGSAIIDEKLDFQKLEKSIRIVCQKHDNFKIKLKIKDGEVFQEFTNEKENIEFINLANEKEFEKFRIKTIKKTFDLESQLYKFYIIKFENGKGAFLLNIHHLISDAWTLALICNDIINIYSKLLNNREIETKSIYSYIDYIKSEKEYHKSEKYKIDKNYWLEKYKTIPEVATIPGSKQNDANVNSVIGERKEFKIDKIQVNKLKQYCKENKISLYNFFMAVYSIYIAEISNLDDFAIGTPILNRTNFKEKNTAGMFINMAPLRIKFSEDITFKDFVKNIAIESLGMLKHQKYSYQSLIEELRKKDKNIPNLYNILISYQITNAQSKEADITYKSEWTFNGCCADDIDIQIYDLNDTGSLNIAYDYKVSIYEGSDIEKLHKRIEYIISQVLNKNDIEIKDIEIVTPKEREKLVYEFNQTDLEYDKTKPIIKYFEEQAEKEPDDIAIVFENKKMTYKELNERANSLAMRLREEGIKNNSVVGILFPRSFETLIAILAVLKSGGAYIPIAIDYPDDRIKYMLEDSNVKVLLTAKKEQNRIKNISKIICIDIDNNEIYENNKINLKNISKPDDLSYLIYTSGSTGTPKGVMLKQQNLSNFYNAMKQKIEYLENKKSKKIISITTTSFDIFEFETLISLANGLTVYMTNENEQKITVLLEKIIKDNQIEIIQTTPSIMKFHLDNLQNKDDIKSLRYIILAGEQLPKSLVNSIEKVLPEVIIYNGYGPSETTIFSTVENVTTENRITIGKPIANTQIYILNKNKKLLPKGTIGEIYISGDGVGKGYVNKEEQTRKNYLLNPYIEEKIMYKSGDLGYYDSHGKIICCGRLDHQVKIKGLRIELSEIEKIISSIYNIENAIVVQKLVKNKKSLCAYYVSKGPIDKKVIKSNLKQKLPQYMIPQYLIQMKEIPYTPNGKIDRKALPEPNEKDENKEITQPRNEIDKELIKMLKNMLNYEDISINDTLLDLGGDSLTGITLSTKILSKYNVQINIKDILSNFTIKNMSDYILKNKNESKEIKIPRIEQREFYPLSSAQKRIYYNSKMISEENTVYNMPGAILIDGILDINKIQESLNKIVQRHEILRTEFVLNGTEIEQKVIENVAIKVPTFYNRSEEIQEIIGKFSKPFKLENEFLIRVEVHYIDNKKTLILVDSHHIIMDGTGLNNLIIEFNRIYNGDNLKRLPIQYRDYSVWEDNFLNSNKINEIESYWINKFKGCDFEQINLPYDYKTVANRTYYGDRVSNIIDEKEFKRIERYAKKNGVSPYVFFLSAFFILLYKYTGQKDINLGSPIANRNINETKRMIGMFVNNIVVRGKINSDETFKEFLDNIKEQVLDDLSYQPYPFDLLVKKLGIQTDPSRNPLFDIMFTYQNKEERSIKINDKESKIIELNNHISKFNLSIEIKPEAHTINIEYSTELFKRQTIERLFEHYMNVLNNIIRDVNIPIKDISIISEEEKEIIMDKFNNEKIKFNLNKSVSDYFYEQSLKGPNNVAVKYKNSKITYSELNLKSNFIAETLINKGIKKGDVVGVNLNRSIELIIYMIAILKIGAIYMPMYINYPKERLEYMLKNSFAKMLITDKKTEINFEGIRENAINYEKIKTLKELPQIEETLNSEKIAYIIYTSGSTGKPKGVQISDRNLINFVQAFKNYYNKEVDFNDRFLATTNISFDVSMWEIFMPLLNGATLVLYEEEIITDIISYVKSIQTNNITSLYIPPNILEEVYSLLKEKENIQINKILVGVEPIQKRTLNKYFQINPNMKIINGYGPTETTICCTALDYKLDLEEGIVSIGKPLTNDNIYIVNSDYNIQPIGIPGEIYVTGNGVGLGYINQKSETEKNFLENKFDNNSQKMYKTGDIAKWNENGTINFIGRNDSQVKISGHRIELSEINHMIMEYPNIIKSYTMIYKKADKDYIVSYYIAEKQIVPQNINAFLKEKLADYAIPNFLIQLEKFPLTPNGKIDKTKLPTNFSSKVEYVEPRDEFEEKLANIFKKLFMLKKVGIDDNFFELGGDSLIAIKFQVEALNEGLKITYADIFSKPTIRKLSDEKNKKVSFKTDKDYNFEKINKLISKNNVTEIENVKRQKVDNVLLIGATGFLGIHILEQLILENTKKIYCIVREKSFIDPVTRLKNYLEFYFGDKYNNLIGNKIIVIDGDITDKLLGQKNEENYTNLAKNIDCVINSAAIVKHYGNLKVFKDTNIIGTENVAEFCRKFNKKLYYISTLSVSGNIMKSKDDINPIQFKEDEFYIGQDLDNVYIYSKFEAEKIILEKILNGLDACIIRIGNITNRYVDGKFQINVAENAFVNRIKSIIKLGVIQEELLEHSLEFTPVDYCAKAITKIIEYNTKFNILHLSNHNFINISKLIKILNELGEKITPVNEKCFKEKINIALKDKEMKANLKGIITDLDENKKLNLINNIIPNDNFTTTYLNKLNFKWPEIDKEYLEKYINYFKNIQYF